MAWPKIAEARKAKGWTQIDLAERLNTTQSVVARWETKDVDIKASALMDLSSTLGVTISYLLGFDLDESGLVDLDPRCSELLGIFSQLNEESRSALMVVARSLACSSQSPLPER